MNLFKRDKSVGMSMPDSEIIHGVEVKKVPIGQYFKTMGSLQNVIFAIIEEVFPEKSVDEIMRSITNINDNETLNLMVGLLASLPEQAVGLLCDVTGFDKEMIFEKTPTEVLDIFQAYWRINDMTRFFQSVRGMMAGLLAPKTGSNAGSR